MADLLARLVSSLSRVDDDGNDVFASDDVRHALPFLVLALELPLDELSDGMQALVVETAARAGAERESDPARALEKLARFYEEHPVAPAILDAVRTALAGDGVEAAPAPGGGALLGQARSTGVLGGGERPPGTISGALARLGALHKRDDDEG